METTEKKNTLEMIKTWAIVGLFVICFFGFMIFSYQYKSTSINSLLICGIKKVFHNETKPDITFSVFLLPKI